MNIQLHTLIGLVVSYQLLNTQYRGIQELHANNV